MLMYGDGVGKAIRELALSDEVEDKIQLKYYRCVHGADWGGKLILNRLTKHQIKCSFYFPFRFKACNERSGPLSLRLLHGVIRYVPMPAIRNTELSFEKARKWTSRCRGELEIISPKLTFSKEFRICFILSVFAFRNHLVLQPFSPKLNVTRNNLFDANKCLFWSSYFCLMSVSCCDVMLIVLQTPTGLVQ